MQCARPANDTGRRGRDLVLGIPQSVPVLVRRRDQPSWVGDVARSPTRRSTWSPGVSTRLAVARGRVRLPVTRCDNLGANGGGADCVEPEYFCEHAGARGPMTATARASPGARSWTPGCPAPYRGRYFYGDNANGNVWTLTPNARATLRLPAPGGPRHRAFGTVIRFLVGPDGALYLGRVEGHILSPEARGRRGRSRRRSSGCGPTRCRPPDPGPRPDAGPPVDAGPIDFGGGHRPGGSPAAHPSSARTRAGCPLHCGD